MAIKDLSIVEVGNNTFTKNDTVFNLFVKKPIYGGGRLMLGDNVFTSNKEISVKDAYSTIVQVKK